MKGMLELNVDTPEGAASIITNGEMVFKQNKNILIDSIPRTIHDVDPLTDIPFEQYAVNDIVDKYYERSERVEYQSNTLVQPLGRAFSTTIEMKVRVPRAQQIRYRPGVLEVIKFAWI